MVLCITWNQCRDHSRAPVHRSPYMGPAARGAPTRQAQPHPTPWGLPRPARAGGLARWAEASEELPVGLRWPRQWLIAAHTATAAYSPGEFVNATKIRIVDVDLLLGGGKKLKIHY